jgi:hypothetical protein
MPTTWWVGSKCNNSPKSLQLLTAVFHFLYLGHNHKEEFQELLMELMRKHGATGKISDIEFAAEKIMQERHVQRWKAQQAAPYGAAFVLAGPEVKAQPLTLVEAPQEEDTEQTAVGAQSEEGAKVEAPQEEGTWQAAGGSQQEGGKAGNAAGEASGKPPPGMRTQGDRGAGGWVACN